MTEYDEPTPTPDDVRWAERVVGLLYLGGVMILGFILGWVLLASRGCGP